MVSVRTATVAAANEIYEAIQQKIKEIHPTIEHTERPIRAICIIALVDDENFEFSLIGAESLHQIIRSLLQTAADISGGKVLEVRRYEG